MTFSKRRVISERRNSRTLLRCTSASLSKFNYMFLWLLTASVLPTGTAVCAVGPTSLSLSCRRQDFGTKRHHTYHLQLYAAQRHLHTQALTLALCMDALLLPRCLWLYALSYALVTSAKLKKKKFLCDIFAKIYLLLRSNERNMFCLCVCVRMRRVTAVGLRALYACHKFYLFWLICSCWSAAASVRFWRVCCCCFFNACLYYTQCVQCSSALIYIFHIVVYICMYSGAIIQARLSAQDSPAPAFNSNNPL